MSQARSHDFQLQTIYISIHSWYFYNMSLKDLKYRVIWIIYDTFFDYFKLFLKIKPLASVAWWPVTELEEHFNVEVIYSFKILMTGMFICLEVIVVLQWADWIIYIQNEVTDKQSAADISFFKSNVSKHCFSPISPLHI